MAFIAEEIETVLLGNALETEEQYLAHRRMGRVTALQAPDRRLVWAVYQCWLRLLRENKLTTFAARRLEALRRLQAGKASVTRYDALFVDELQDLPVTAIRFLEHCVVHPSRLTFAADTAQSIYLKAPSWARVSDNLRFTRGNSFILKRSYRMTREISRAIAPLRQAAGEEDRDSSIAESVFTGPQPAWMEKPSREHARRAAEIAWELTEAKGINPGQIALIGYTTEDVTTLLKHLKELDIDGSRVDAETAIRPDADQVHVLTAHAAKGLEFPVVIVPWVTEGTYPHSVALKGCRDEADRQEEFERGKRLLYVALSRAARMLYMITDPECPSPFLAELDRTVWDLGTDHGRLA